MVDLTSIRVRGELYVPDKYKNQASEYNKCVQGVNTTLDGAITELESINSMLGLDSESAKDVLTKNVLVGNEEIKTEIKSLVDDLGNYSGVVEKVAKDLDEELRQEVLAVKAKLDRQAALRKTQLEESNSKLESETVTSVPDRVNLNPHIRDDKNVRLMM